MRNKKVFSEFLGYELNMFRKWKDPLNSFKTNTKFKVLEHDKHMRCNNSLAHYATFKELIPKTRTVCMAFYSW